MITLVTGVPGSSKTLNAIDMVLNDPAFQGREVYAYNIQGLTLPWQTLDTDEAKRWYDLPHGSVILLDECQDLFPPEKFGNKVPEHISRLNTHRHLGIDLVLITQHPKLIDTKVRRLVGQHIHYKRQFGMQSATRYTFQECADDPNDYHALKAATKTRKKFNKKLFGVYKSAEVHTHKRKLPWQLWALLAFFLFTVYLIYSVVASYGQSDASLLNAAPIPTLPATGVPGTPAPEAGMRDDGNIMTREQYLTHWTPRIEGIPHSAPAYDDVYEVRDFPRPQCLLSEEKQSCHCYTQQATPLDIPEPQCRQIVANGYWDPTREPPRVARASRREGESGPEQSQAHERILRALEIRAQTRELQF